MKTTAVAVALLLGGWAASPFASAQDAEWGPETNTVVGRAALQQAGSGLREHRVVISDCRRIAPRVRSCRAGAYPLADHVVIWERRVRFQFVQRELADGGPLWWGQVDHGAGVLERLYITLRDLTVTRITRVPGEGHTVTVPRVLPDSDLGLAP